MMATDVDCIELADNSHWNDYIDAKSEATLFHDLRWLDAVKSAYGYPIFRLVAKRRGIIVGVLPLTLVKSPLLGRSLISVAFGVGGGIVSDDSVAAHALSARAIDLGRRFGVNYVELRGGATPGDGYAEKAGIYASFAKEMPSNAEEIRPWLPRNRRAEVKKSLRIDERMENTFRIADDVDEFYEVYAAALRDLGTPVMPKKFLKTLKANFGNEAEIAIIKQLGEPVAGLMSFWRRDRVMPYYIGAGPKARLIRAYDYLYYSLMRRAVEKGIRIFDFGRSKVGSTHFDTKTYWGFEPASVIYYVALIRAKELPNVNPENPKFEKCVALWRCLPLSVTNVLGPIVARNFP